MLTESSNIQKNPVFQASIFSLVILFLNFMLHYFLLGDINFIRKPILVLLNIPSFIWFYANIFLVKYLGIDFLLLPPFIGLITSSVIDGLFIVLLWKRRSLFRRIESKIILISITLYFIVISAIFRSYHMNMILPDSKHFATFEILDILAKFTLHDSFSCKSTRVWVSIPLFEHVLFSGLVIIMGIWLLYITVNHIRQRFAVEKTKPENVL